MIYNIQRACFVLFILLNVSLASAQVFEAKNYPQNYFAYPVIAERSLSGNFGELRPNHFHMGLDCRTERVQNKQVIAAADGYVARVKIESWGYGRAIYINHPNGFTTVYAHLNDFFPELEQYVKEQQYDLESWAIDLEIPAGRFPVTKESFIALSGNTGGSMGPHLHFEIRDTKTEKVLNPLLFGFPIPDKVAPDVYKLAVYDRRISTYEQTPKLYSLKKVGTGYVPSPSLVVAKTDKVSFGIVASDRHSGSGNKNGIYETVLYDNEIPIVGFQMDSIGYDETRCLNAHIDYRYRSRGGAYIQHVSKLPGYNNGIYKSVNGDGVINIGDDSLHQIKLEVKDTYGNLSTVKFSVKRHSSVTGAVQTAETVFQPGSVNLFENDNISFYLPENSLYDSIRFVFKESEAGSGYPIYQIHNTSVPVNGYFPITIKAVSDRPEKMVMHRFANGKNDFRKADPVVHGKDSGWYRASFREFGSFQLMKDTEPPEIIPVGFRSGMDCSKQTRIVFVVKDNTEDLKRFTATLDGNWLCFSNDKGSRFIYEFDEKCAAGEHELKIIAEDMVGNSTERAYKFTR